MDEMNEQVRKAALKRLKQRGLSRAKLADELGKEYTNVARMLNGRSGVVPEGWQELLDLLDLKLIAVPKDFPEPEE